VFDVFRIRRLERICTLLWRVGTRRERTTPSSMPGSLQFSTCTKRISFAFVVETCRHLSNIAACRITRALRGTML